jgi:Protein of unknown function (DUF3800)
MFQSLSALERIALGREGGTVIIATYYLDESGSLNRDAYVVLGGAVANDAEWEVMSNRWNDILRQRGIQYVKMGEAANYAGQFENWKKREPERDSLLLELVEMSWPLVRFYISSPIDTSIFKKLGEKRIKRLKDPWYLGFEATLKQLLDGMNNPEMVLHIICDHSDEFAPRCLGLYQTLRDNNALFKQRCIGITFGDDRFFPPLQLADIYAYCAREDAGRKHKEPRPIVEKLLRVFLQRRSINNAVIYDVEDGLGDAKLEKP